MTTALNPPQPVVEIAERLERAGYEAWCVGGAVRDALLGHAHLDWDLATAATPAQVRALFRRTVPVGIEFGTVGVFDRTGVMHEVTTFRRDVQTDGRHAIVEFGGSLDDDLARRDFTINAIAWSPTRRELRDPFDGQGDLNRRVIRAVGDASARMSEDRLRALRAMRFAARFDFTIEPATWQAIVGSAAHLGRLSPERVKQEIDKTLEQAQSPSRAFALWREGGAFGTLVPSLAEATDLDLRAIDFVARPSGANRTADRRLLRLAVLLAAIGPEAAARTMKALRYSNQEGAWVGSVVERWHRVHGSLERELNTPRAIPAATVRRWVSGAGRVRIRAVLRVAAARWDAAREAERPAPSPRAVRDLYRRAIHSAFHDPVEISDLAVDGDDLRSAGLAPGPLLGKILQGLLDWVLEDPRRNVPDSLLAQASELRLSLGSTR
jgi:tRNA nucleotidyltransferase (CCA-adding enzyme)